MLVMWRHPGESIFISEDVELEVLECGPNRVKLGIRAPQRVPVVRGEVKRTRDQNLAAARSIGNRVLPGALKQLRSDIPLSGGPLP